MRGNIMHMSVIRSTFSSPFLIQNYYCVQRNREVSGWALCAWWQRDSVQGWARVLCMGSVGTEQRSACTISSLVRRAEEWAQIKSRKWGATAGTHSLIIWMFSGNQRYSNNLGKEKIPKFTLVSVFNRGFGDVCNKVRLHYQGLLTLIL